MAEYIGLLGTLSVLLAFTRKGELQIRLISLLGAFIFLIYGITTNALSIILLNSILICIHIIRIYQLTKEQMDKPSVDVFLICPVRNATEQQKLKIAEYIKNIEHSGKSIHYPARDTNQNDSIGYRICTDNKQAMKRAREVHIFWDKNSNGTLFDLGMAFALSKTLHIVNADRKSVV